MEINRQAPVIGRSEGVVRAPRETVWAVLTTLEEWPDWNPAVSRLKQMGPLAPGTEFHWVGGNVKIRSQLLEVNSPTHIAWKGQAPLGIRAVHTWTLSAEGAHTRAVTEESFEGLLARLLRGRMKRDLQKALDDGMRALNAEVERRGGMGTA